MEDRHESYDGDELRNKAENHIGRSGLSDTTGIPDVDVHILFHELQVHQIELEMQYKELQHAKMEAEDALRKFSDLYDFAPVGYLTLDEYNRILEANLTASTMLGVPRSELIGVLFQSFIAPECSSDFNGFCKKLSDSRGMDSREFTLLKSMKHPFHVLAKATNATGYSGSPTKCHITITDITRRKKAEDALQRAYVELEEKVEERTYELAEARADAERRASELESFIASMADGVVLFDAVGNVRFINDIGMDMLGFPGAESFDGWFERYQLCDLRGKPIPIEKNVLSRALNGEIVSDKRGILLTPWGKKVTLSVSASPVLSGQGNIIGATMVFRDQSDRVSIEKERQALLERERNIAEILEGAVIPHGEHDVLGCRVAVRYEPALAEAGVGGDFYDVFELDDGKVGVLIGDVAGKGLAAAVGIAGIRYSIRSYAYLDPRPSRVMTLANEALYRSEAGQKGFGMLTAFFAVIDTRFGGITYASGGHEPALLRTTDGNTERLIADGIVLGVVRDFEYTECSRKLLPGDIVAMVTDGITEARTNPMSLFSIEGVEQYLTESPQINLDAIAEGILQAAKDHAGGHFTDDAAVVVVSLDKEDSSERENTLYSG